jgi:hypothetical protein
VARSPALVNYSTTVTADFSHYTSVVKFGSLVNFTATAPAAVPATATTRAGGIAAVKIGSQSPGKFTVTATAGAIAGSTSVTFIDQPARADVAITPNRQMTGLEALHFTLKSDLPVTFTAYSTLKGGGVLSLTNPATLPAPGTGEITAALLAVPGVNVPPTAALFKFRFDMAPPGIPVFSVITDEASFADPASALPAPIFTASPTFYDRNGRVLFP